ncbi:MAG: GAF domain-containing protein, partial [Acidobacteria bacterium]|nr:GAF domain-containing protein [Acidobacteriota bacterium]
MVDRICSLTKADGVVVAVRDQRGIVCRASTANAPEVGSRIQPNSALMRECLETGHIVICGSVDENCRIGESIAGSLQLRSALIVPLRTRDSVFGVVGVFSSRAFAFDQAHAAALQRVAEGVTPSLADAAISKAPAESIDRALPDRRAEPKWRAHAYVVPAIAFLCLSVLLLVMRFHQWRAQAPSPKSLPLSSAPGRPATKPQRQVQDENVSPANGNGSSRANLSSTATSSSSFVWKPTSGSNRKPAENTLTIEVRPEIISPSVPALRILSAPPGAQVFVDERLLATANLEGQANIWGLPAGQHQLSLRLEGYLDYSRAIEVREKQTSTITANLETLTMPASQIPTLPSIIAGIPSLPALVKPRLTSEPDFVLHRNLKGHSSWVTTMAFSPDGERLASGSWDQTLKLWQLSSGEQLSASKMAEIQALAFSRDGHWLAIENSADTVVLRDALTGREIRTLPSSKPLRPLGTNWIYSIAFSPDGRWLATALDDKTVRLWDIDTGRGVRDFVASRHSITYIAFSPDGRLLASGDGDKTIRIWNTADGRELQKLSGHRKTVYSVAFSPNGSLLASASGDKTVRLWDVERGREIRLLSGHKDVVSSLAFSPDGRWLVSGSWDKTI